MSKKTQKPERGNLEGTMVHVRASIARDDKLKARIKRLEQKVAKLARK